MFNISKDQQTLLTGIAIGTLIGTLSSALFFILSTSAALKESVKTVNKIGLNEEKIKTDPAEQEKPKKRTRTKKTETGGE